MKFEIGMIVRLKGEETNPFMTVMNNNRHDDIVLCGWFNANSEYRQEYLHRNALEVLEPVKPQ